MNVKYFSISGARWLAAETIVIVLGILIALGVDDYRTLRSERALEFQYVQRISSDLEKDLQFLSNTYYPNLRRKQSALELVAPVVRGQSPVPDDVFSYLENVSLGGLMGVPSAGWFTDTSFQDMLATGNLRLIRDPQIRADIANYYETLESDLSRIQNRSTGYVMFVHSILPSELRSDFNAQSVEQYGADYAVQRTLSDEFRNLLNQEYNAMLFMQSRPFEQYVTTLLDSLENYRARLEGD